MVLCSIKLTVLIIVLLFWRSYPYLTAKCVEKYHRVPQADSITLQLHKLEVELPPYQSRPLAAKDWDFHLLETRDLTEASELALECFYSPRLTLSLEGMSEAEKWVWGGVINFYTAVDKSDTRNGNYLGMRSRSGSRLSSPTLSLSTDSFILVATPAIHLLDRSKPEIAAIVEICVEQPGGKLAPPVANPFRSKAAKDSEQPYLCNLCVGKAFRRRGLGRLICELSEELVQMHWKKDMMYLHVEQSNRAAQALYLGMGYQLVSPGLSAWEKKMEGMENILYYSNRLKRQWVDPSLAVEGFQDLVKSSPSSSESSDRDSSVLLGMSDLDMKIASNIMRSKA